MILLGNKMEMQFELCDIKGLIKLSGDCSCVCCLHVLLRFSIC